MNSELAILPESSILIIDDSTDNLRVLSKTLTAYGYDVRCVTHSSMAFVSIQNAPPDLILLDIRMPGMDGYEVCRQLKQNLATQDTPVIFLSALDDVKDIVKAFQVGGVDYITKPFQAEEVLARIQNQLTIQTLRKKLFEQNQHLLQEIDERKKFEQELCQEIQRRILIEASLQDAKNAAEAANCVKSEFLAQMSHELRTPLNAILGFTTLMTKDISSTSTHQQYVETIDENARRLLKLINNILSVTRAESSQLSLDEHEFDLHLLLDSVVALWQPKALEKGLQFEFQRAAEVPQYIYSDESKLRQILMNLLDNAIQITEKGSVTIRIDAEERISFPDETCNLIIEVRDTGTKIVLDELDGAFQMVSQPKSNQKLSQELRLSLLLIRQFAQLMGGNIVFKSCPKQGSIIYVHVLVRLTQSIFSQLHSKSSTYVVQSTPDEGTLTVETLKLVMPNDWFMQLHQAAVKGFDQQILHLLQKIPVSHASLAKTLEMWTHNFQFDRIVEITQHVAS
ncbi:MAG: response regulator [Cyanobacteria bacterium RM1_2_2]|nr:response regulator [Cyanobacteria bacterium RM1_2_2]